MSRVDEDRDAARVATRLAEAKRNEEGQKTKKAAENNAVSKLVQGQKKEVQVKQEGNLARSAIAQLLEAAESGHADEAKHLEQGMQGSQQESAFKSKLGSKGPGPEGSAEQPLRRQADGSGQGAGRAGTLFDRQQPPGRSIGQRQSRPGPQW